MTRERIRQIERKALERAPIDFWCHQSWFAEGVAKDFESMRNGRTLAYLVCADPVAKRSQMGKELDDPGWKIRKIQLFVQEMAGRASESLDPFGELSEASWELLRDPTPSDFSVTTDPES